MARASVIGTLKGSSTKKILEVPSDYQGPRGTAPNDKSLKSFISGAAPRNPMAPPLETPAPPLETPRAPRLKTPGDKI